MKLEWIWESALIVLAGMLLLRLAGRKSISQMTVATTVITISIGTTIVQPVASHHLSVALGSSLVFILTLLLVEYLGVRWKWLEWLLNGRPKVVIQGGQPVPSEMRKLRFTIEEIEMNLRQQGIANIADVETATLEPNGSLACQLKREARPVTVGELEALLKKHLPVASEPAPLFSEVRAESAAKGPPEQTSS